MSFYYLITYFSLKYDSPIHIYNSFILIIEKIIYIWEKILINHILITHTKKKKKKKYQIIEIKNMEWKMNYKLAQLV